VITTQIHGAVGEIKVSGRFTFVDAAAFKASINEIMEGHWITEIDLNLSEASYMDSNALSMLISLREKSQAKNINLKLVKPSPSIRTILEMVQFDQLFPIID
jgi:HptB-dependent secretion and biofilm anti anti-sigma factor